MLPNDVRRNIDRAWDALWSSGTSNPLLCVDYLTALLFVQFSGDESNAEFRSALSEGDRSRVLSVLAATQPEADTREGLLTPEAMWSDLETLRIVVHALSELSIGERNRDVLGDVYEYMLSKMSTAGHFGQFRTPRHLIRFVTEAVGPKPDEAVLDPSCGTGGFLIAAAELAGDGRTAQLRGEEIDPTIAKLARTNIALHGLSNAAVVTRDSLGPERSLADVILANPPFSGTVSEGRAETFSIRTRKTELLFLELMMDRLAPGGRAGVVMPWGVLTSTASAAVAIRKRLLTESRLEAVVEFPSGVFRPYTGVRTAILLWSNNPPVDSVRMIRIDNDGFTLDDRREETEGSELPGALAILSGTAHDGPTPIHASVAVSDIEKNGWRISPSTFVQHRPSEVRETESANAVVRDLATALASLSSLVDQVEDVLTTASTTIEVSSVRLRELCDPVREGIQPKQIQPDAQYVGLEHIRPGSGSWTSIPAEQAALRSAKSTFQPGDLLYGKLRPNLRKCVVVDVPGVCSTDITVLRPRDPQIAQYLALQLRSQAFADEASRHVGGANLPRIRIGDLLELGIPMPTSTDQTLLMTSLVANAQAIASGALDVTDAVSRLGESLSDLNLEFVDDAK